MAKHRHHLVDALEGLQAPREQEVGAGAAELGKAAATSVASGSGRKQGSTSISMGNPNSRCLARLNSLKAMNTDAIIAASRPPLAPALTLSPL
jgi:hypothetical protein